MIRGLHPSPTRQRYFIPLFFYLDAGTPARHAMVPLESFIGEGPYELTLQPLFGTLSSAISSQFLDHGAMLSQQIQGNIRPCLRRKLVVNIEDILPGLSLHRARLYLSQIRSLASKHFQSRDQCSGPVLYGERQAHFIRFGIRRHIFAAPDQEEPRVVLCVIFNAAGENLAPIILGCTRACDGSRAAITKFHQLLDASSCVVKRNGVDGWMLFEKSAALRKS